MNENTPVDPTLIGIAQAISRVEQRQEDFQRELLGNGQPGKIGIIEKELSDLEKRVGKHENKMSWYNGIFVASGVLIHAVLHKLGF